MPPDERHFAESVVDCDEHGWPVSERYQRLGARGVQEEGMFVRFEPGFGLNVHIGFRARVLTPGVWRPRSEPPEDVDRLVLSIQGWERLCELVDEWRERERLIDGGEDER